MNASQILLREIGILLAVMAQKQEEIKAKAIAEGKEVDNWDVRRAGEDEQRIVKELQFCLSVLQMRTTLNDLYSNVK